MPYRTFDKLRSVHRSEIVENKRLDEALTMVAEMQAEQGVPCIIRSNAPEILMDWLRSKKASDGAEPGLPLPAAAATLSVSVAEMVEMVRDGRARVAGLKDGPG